MNEDVDVDVDVEVEVVNLINTGGRRVLVVLAKPSLPLKVKVGVGPVQGCF